MTRSQTPLSLEYILLGFLYQNPIHGYDLYKKISKFEAISLVWHLKQNQLYALLDKLKENDLLTFNMVPGEAYLMRKEYRITSVGRRSFLTWVTSPVSHGRDMRQEFLAKLYFAQNSGIDVALKLIEKQRSACAEWLSGLRIDLSKISEEKHFERTLFLYRIAQTQAMIEWLDLSRNEIQDALIQNSGINPSGILYETDWRN
jgi:PadR family transcriptional regulator AphA